ncbi:MAG: Hsp20/alpha crystallin family protein [Caldiserica bacterium]|nr:Hsp20/alpha crystallin family protein [Caldisericota bacterium]
MEWWDEEEWHLGWRRPFGFFMRLGRTLRDLEELFSRWEEFGLGPGRTDIYIKDRTLVIETELPGVRKEDIRVQVEGDKLIVSGEVHRAEEVREENYIRMGRRYGAFRRVFPLPEEVEDPGKIKARFENGVLRIEVPLRRPPERGGVTDIPVE